VSPSWQLSARQPQWLEQALDSLSRHGFAIVEDVLGSDQIERMRVALYRVRDLIVGEVGSERLETAGELGVLRLMLRYDERFYSLLELDEVLAIVDHTVSATGILHLQNGLILPSFPPGSAPDVFQTSFHRDFPRYMGGYVASINTFVTIDEFTDENGATLVVPGSHQRAEPPEHAEMLAGAVPAVCPAGSMIAFDSTLWHAAGTNTSGCDRLAVNQQFTRSFIKQQIDYVRAIGADNVVRQPERTQQLLGWYTRVVTCLQEYYVPAEERLYRAGQG
jgi:ectoine hydroxylase-related dioxygenase (phytanoyl-CoA dioxygenase family)